MIGKKKLIKLTQDTTTSSSYYFRISPVNFQSLPRSLANGLSIFLEVFQEVSLWLVWTVGLVWRASHRPFAWRVRTTLSIFLLSTLICRWFHIDFGCFHFELYLLNWTPRLISGLSFRLLAVGFWFWWFQLLFLRRRLRWVVCRFYICGSYSPWTYIYIVPRYLKTNL